MTVPMLGLMQQHPLLVSSLLKHAERHHARVEIVSRRTEGDIHRETMVELAARARRLANALSSLGVGQGDRVATLAWNTHRHMELYYAVSGSGAVLHTLNPRLAQAQFRYIVDHAADKVLFFDSSFLPVIEAVAGELRGVRNWVLMTDRQHMPERSAIPGLFCFEELIDVHDDRLEWTVFDENTASSLCYTSGTTGLPKGVLYSHRSTVLHSLVAASQDGLNVSGQDAVLPIVPMFHVNAWGLPYIACMVGAKIVLPGPNLDGASLHDLIESERVTVAAGVPTVWQGLMAHLQSTGQHFTALKRTIIGGSACPPVLMRTLQETYGVRVSHAWGMTELSPLGVSCTFRPHHFELPQDAQYAIQAKQGRAVFGVDIRIVGDDGSELEWDGTTAGELQVRGPWVTSGYFGDENSPLVDGWFPTGDVGTVDREGYFQITDRRKDVIKSGGEWIGSIDLEAVAMAHPAIAMAACIAVPHPKWDERPLIVAVRKPGVVVEREELLAFFQGKVPNWWVPDDVVFVSEIALGATGKMLKHQLRSQFKNYKLPDARRNREA